MKHCLHIAVFFFIINQVPLGLGFGKFKDSFLNEDAFLNFTQLARKYGHSAEEYEVTTEDGYVLGLFRIPVFKDNNRLEKRLPLFLMHGNLDSADAWIMRGKNSLAITLANAGYDVWCGNVRGNKYSRKHVSLNFDDPVFWNFTFNEIGIFDLAKMIDFVLMETGAAKLNAIGHSQGNTIFYVLGSMKTEYNEKVNVLIALAPVAYFHNVAKPVRALIKVLPSIFSKGYLKGIVSFPGKALDEYFRKLCSKPIIGYAKCILGIVFPLTGYDPSQYEPAFLKVVVGHFPTETSIKNLEHFAQVSRRKSFARYDYGPARNLEVYGSEAPPSYALERVTMRVALLVGRNDYLATERDVALLRARLPHVVRYEEIRRRKMAHLDFVNGKDMKYYLFPLIFEILNDFQ